MKLSTAMLLMISSIIIAASGVGALLTTRAEGAGQEATYVSSKITCGACVEKLNQALQPLAGVKKVAVDVAASQVRVRFDPERTNPGVLAFAMADAGYPARLAVGPGGAGQAAPDGSAGGCGGGCCAR
ncbi:MAG: heavy-metal-associated domain-containing protein [Desulfuromonadales bacterium]